MSFQLPPVPVTYGRRRHRFMESSDFNAAAFRILDSVRQAIADGKTVGSCFFSAFMDPASPGQVDSVLIPPIDQSPLLRVMELSPSVAASVGMGIQALLSDPEAPPSLAAYLRATPASSASSKSSRLLTLDIWSVDTTATSTCRVDNLSRTLLVSPLVFRGRR